MVVIDFVNMLPMSTAVLQAVVLILGAAVMNAAYVLPMRLNRNWKWEHSWFAFSLLGVAVVPTLITMAAVPDLWSIYGAVSAGALFEMALYGALWGVSLVLFGLALPLVGLAITFAVCLGTSAASGALLPLLGRREPLREGQGLLIAAGLGVIVLGVALCGAAGHWRDAAGEGRKAARSGDSVRGFLYALVSGVMGSMLNLGLAMGGDIQRMARERGATPAMMSNAVWLPCLYAGFAPGVIYCLYLMRKNHNLAALTRSARWYYWLMGASMGALWFGSIILYSFSTVKLGELGPVIGWPLFMSAVVIASMVTGLWAGEWKKAGPGPLRVMLAGLFCLVAAMTLLAAAGK